MSKTLTVSLQRFIKNPCKCSGLDIKQSKGEATIIPVLLGNTKYPFIVIAPRSTLSRSGSTKGSPIYVSNKIV